MSKTQAETVIKNIIREIIQECTTRGQIVSETLVAFIVKAVVLDPDNQFHVDRQLTKDDVQKLIKVLRSFYQELKLYIEAYFCVKSCALTIYLTFVHLHWTQ